MRKVRGDVRDAKFAPIGAQFESPRCNELCECNLGECHKFI